MESIRVFLRGSIHNSVKHDIIAPISDFTKGLWTSLERTFQPSDMWPNYIPNC